jgi:hypothetical protein
MNDTLGDEVEIGGILCSSNWRKYCNSLNECIIQGAILPPRAESSAIALFPLFFGDRREGPNGNDVVADDRVVGARQRSKPR